jgi:phage terminase small subunit
MPVLKNPKHERFAQELAKGKTSEQAYEDAGYEPHPPNASRLIRNDKVIARLAELQGRVAEQVVVTAVSLIAKLEEIGRLATRDGQYGAAVAAAKEQGVLSGVRVEKSDRTTTDKRDVADWTDADLVNVIRGARTGGGGTPEKEASSKEPDKLH